MSAIENATRPTPSLTRLSASRIVRSFVGAERRADHGGRAHRIGRAEHGAEHEGAARAERRDRRPGDAADGEERRRGQAEREQQDREPVLAHLARRGEERGRVEERRQEAEEDDVRRQPDLLDPRARPRRRARRARGSRAPGRGCGCARTALTMTAAASASPTRSGWLTARREHIARLQGDGQPPRVWRSSRTRLRHEPVVRPGAAAARLDEPGVSQNLQMVRDRRLRQVEGGVQVADAAFVRRPRAG